MIRVHQADVPMPYAKNLERAAKPDVAKTIAAVKKVMYLRVNGSWRSALGTRSNCSSSSRLPIPSPTPERTMATKVFMEALSPTMEEGRLVKWIKNEGDAVKNGESLAEVETDKAIMELVARGDGVLRKRLIAEGDTRAGGRRSSA